MPHITFIHGIANKPAADKLLKLWIDSLAGDYLGNNDSLDLGASGITSSMIYWADVLYDNPLPDTALESLTSYESTEDVVLGDDSEPDMTWRENISPREKRIVDSLSAKLQVDALIDDLVTPNQAGIDKSLERIPLPWFIKRRLMKQLLKDVHHYLFNYEYSPRSVTKYKVQDEIRQRVLTHLSSIKTDRHIVVSHSMGTVIIYDCLKRVAACPPIDGLMTIGSPLGIDEVQDMLKPEWTRNDSFPEKVKGKWINIYDWLDPVAGFDGNIANDFKQAGIEKIEVINEQNWGNWRHNITNYLSGPKLRTALREMLEL